MQSCKDKNAIHRWTHHEESVEMIWSYVTKRWPVHKASYPMGTDWNAPTRKIATDTGENDEEGGWGPLATTGGTSDVSWWVEKTGEGPMRRTALEAVTGNKDKNDCIVTSKKQKCKKHKKQITRFIWNFRFNTVWIGNSHNFIVSHHIAGLIVKWSNQPRYHIRRKITIFELTLSRKRVLR